jgi:phosphinothricin acetyltransferase
MTPALRLATEADLPAINAIYNHYVVHSTCTYQIAPETAEARLHWFRKRSPVHPVTVAVVDGTVVGWASLNSFHPREAYARTVDNSVYIHPEWQRRGLGGLLLRDLIERARALGHHTILAGISSEQTPSIALHETHGFVQVGHLREVGFKHGQWLDVLTMQLML